MSSAGHCPYVEFCREHDAGVTVRGVRNRSDLRREHQLAAMNQALGVATLLPSARPGLAGVSSTALRGLGRRPISRADDVGATVRSNDDECDFDL